jgi:glycosyltransferase involved in cell wall biosynthesis
LYVAATGETHSIWKVADAAFKLAGISTGCQVLMESTNDSPSPLVTVIVPAYNYGKFIAETLRSVQKQTYQQWECIVVDDGSTDDTGAVVAGFVARDGRIKYVRQANLGLAAARNTGIANSAGDYLQFLDADDLLERRKLERQVEILEQHPQVDIVFADARYFKTEAVGKLLFSQDEENLPWVTNLSARGKEVLRRLVGNNIMVVNAPLLRRSVINDVGLFDGSVKGIEDWHYWVRCAIAEKHFHYDDSEETRALVRIHPHSMSTDGRLMLRSTLLMHRKFAGMVSDPSLLQLNKERMTQREGLLGIEEVASGKLLAGMRQLGKAAWLDHRARYRAKWILCALSAPFVSAGRLRKMVALPTLEILRDMLKADEPSRQRDS